MDGWGADLSLRGGAGLWPTSTSPPGGCLTHIHIYTHQSVIFSATQETSLLGRGEWIKFAAAFFNLDHVADKKFEEVRHSVYIDDLAGYMEVHASIDQNRHRSTLPSF